MALKQFKLNISLPFMKQLLFLLLQKMQSDIFSRLGGKSAMQWLQRRRGFFSACQKNEDFTDFFCLCREEMQNPQNKTAAFSSLMATFLHLLTT